MRDHVDQLIVVIVSGRPVMLDRIQPLADVIVAAWLPGTEGAGIADVLFGDQPFQGTTPYAWPSTPADAPRTGKAPCEGAGSRPASASTRPGSSWARRAASSGLSASVVCASVTPVNASRVGCAVIGLSA